MVIKQGSTVNLAIGLAKSEIILSPDIVSILEATVQNVTYYYPGLIYWDNVKGKFILPLGQKDTFRLINPTTIQIRVKDKQGKVSATDIMTIPVDQSISKKVL